MAKTQDSSIRSFLNDLVPADEIRGAAHRLGVVRRRRKIDIVEFVMIVVVIVCGRGGQTIASMRRQLAARGTTVARSAFWKRLTPAFEMLVSWLLERLQKESRSSPPVYRGALASFTDVIAVDSTVIKVHDSLAKIWKGTRHTRKAALKVHTMVRALTGELLRHKITAEAHGDGRELRVGRWAKGALFFFDRAYSEASMWWRIHRLRGFFITRLPASFRPVVTAVNRRHRGRSRGLVGRVLSDELAKLKRAIIDVNCAFNIRVRGYAGLRGRRFQHDFRVVAIWQPEHHRYLTFVTNLPADVFSPEQVAEFYRLRWEVETFYKTGKSGLGLDELPSRQPHIVRTLVKAALIRATIAMRARLVAERTLPASRWINPGQWTHVWRERLAELARSTSRSFGWADLARLAVDPNRKRPPLRRVALLGWLEENISGNSGLPGCLC